MEVNVEREQATAEPQQIAHLIKEKLARTVRSNAKKDAALTSLHATSSLPGLSLEKRRALAAEIAADPAFSDIKSVTTSGGLAFLYSSTFLSPAEAARKASIDQTKFVISEKVRNDTRDKVLLTTKAALRELCPELPPERFEALLQEMQGEPRYQDLKQVPGCEERYFYSNMYMTDKYAALLARAAGKAPCAVVADTVREESQIYPRPTNVQIFKSQVYGIPHKSIEATIAGVLLDPRYADIRKLLHPGTGEVYLYSAQYLNEQDALAALRDEERGQS
jgi:hypothetical protein